MLPEVPGLAVLLMAAMIPAPGAEISGLGVPVTVGPALVNQHASPAIGGSEARNGSVIPPAASRNGILTPTLPPVMLVQLGRLTVHPTARIEGWVPGRLI